MKKELINKLIFTKTAIDIILKKYCVLNNTATFTNLDCWIHIHNVNQPDGIYSLIGNTNEKTEDFPSFVDDIEMTGALSSDEVLKIVSYAKCAANDELRPVFGGVYIDEKNICASDAHVLRYEPFNNAFRKNVIIPKDNLNKLAYLTKEFNYPALSVGTSKDYVFFGCNDFSFIVRLIDGTYPSYMSVIPNGKGYEKKFTITKETFKEVQACISDFKKANGTIPGNGVASLVDGFITVRDIDFGFEKSFPIKEEDVSSPEIINTIIMPYMSDYGLSVKIDVLGKLVDSDFCLYTNDDRSRALIYQPIEPDTISKKEKDLKS